MARRRGTEHARLVRSGTLPSGKGTELCLQRQPDGRPGPAAIGGEGSRQKKVVGEGVGCTSSIRKKVLRFDVDKSFTPCRVPGPALFFHCPSPSNCRIPSGEFRNHGLILEHHTFFYPFHFGVWEISASVKAGSGDRGLQVDNQNRGGCQRL